MSATLYLTPKDRGRPLTLREFEAAGSLEGYHYELIHGKLEVSPLPDLPHDDLLEWLQEKLRAYGLVHPEVLNKVKGPVRVFVPDGPAVTAPEPDVAAYRNYPTERPIAQRRWQDVTPFLVAEVVSEDSADKDLVRNVELYRLIPEIREYWILDPRDDPDRPSLIVYRRRGRQWQRPVRVGPGGIYTTRLLPGFALVLDPHQ
jgi:Uma2 family endonuclease